MLKYAYFIGAGGIGMSALIRHLLRIGVEVHGYDKTPSPLTEALISEGAQIHFEDLPEAIPPSWLEAAEDEVLWVFTPAIPASHRELNRLKELKKPLIKRSQLLGKLTRDTFSIAIGGTHGKTTTSCMTATLLSVLQQKQAAFLGGISADLGSNYFFREGEGPMFTTCEADEFDRSFLQLQPDIAVVTSVDPDHLDIYGEKEAVPEAYRSFVAQIKEGGTLFCRSGLKDVLRPQSHIHCQEYGLEQGDIHAGNLQFAEGMMRFDYHQKGNGIVIPDLELSVPGLHNVENALVAIAIALRMGCSEAFIRSALKSFKGVKRRFEYILRSENTILIDDYAHHPTELEAVIASVKRMYPGRRICGIFQPHLYTRTRDFADGFAQALDGLDEALLMDIYPARELPIPGVSSQIIRERMKRPASIVSREEIPQRVRDLQPEIMLILGAGDIDREVTRIREAME